MLFVFCTLLAPDPFPLLLLVLRRMTEVCEPLEPATLPLTLAGKLEWMNWPF